MKKITLTIFFLSYILYGSAFSKAPDSVYLFSYSTTLNDNHNGLHFAWSINKSEWYPVGREFSFLRSDYGRGRIEKRMYHPNLFRLPDGTWQCIWELNQREPIFAQSSSTNLVDWGRQNYIESKPSKNVLSPVISYDEFLKKYLISYRSAEGRYWRMGTVNFQNYGSVNEMQSEIIPTNKFTVTLPSGTWTGQLHRVPFAMVDALKKRVQASEMERLKKGENSSQDQQRFKALKELKASVTLKVSEARSISNLLTGVFFEDINYSADGGLYAELLQNRGFEYQLSDKLDRDSSWNGKHAWILEGEDAQFEIRNQAPLHPNNPHYAWLEIKKPGAGLINIGFDGISVDKGLGYRISFFAKKPGKVGKLEITLVSKTGNVIGTKLIELSSGGWKKYETIITAMQTEDGSRLRLKPLFTGNLSLDMVSLFPLNTFKGRRNGMRNDLAQTIAAIKPKFIRFPGGCVAHGDGLGNIYRWKNTIGPLEARIPQRNIWNYHQSMGLGYFEYFQLCEDIGAVPLPVLAAGVSCQNSGVGGNGQQGGIPMDKMDEYVQDILDLVEYANGDIKTTWGMKRARSGHPKPFGLKYIGIGNEDLISNVFAERFKMIFQAVKKKYPEITVIGTSGPLQEGSDYIEGWKLADSLKLPMVDEHYYQPPGWFINHQDFYDSYDRSRSKVYLGEYASQGNTWFNALSESLYMTGLERNGDVVSMASYAPLLAKKGRTQWNPDLIYFNNRETMPTVNYEIQKLYGQFSGNRYIPVNVGLSDTSEEVAKRFAVSVVADSLTGDVFVKLSNVLPVSIEISMDFNGLFQGEQKLGRMVLYADPDEKSNVSKVENEIQSGSKIVLAPYSVTLLRSNSKR